MLEKLKKYEYLPFFILINIFLFIFLMQNPIYNVNTAFSDTGIYQLMSKEMLNSKILYKDIFDIKGPFIFFIYLIANLFKNVNLGLFIIDLILYNSILYLNYKTIKLNHNNITNFLFIIIELFLIHNTHRIVCPESFMLLTISYLNYWILSKEYLNPTKTQLIICGILTGLIFWIKFSLGVYIALIYFYFIFTHIKNKTFNYKYVLMPLVGFLIPTAIVFGYFIYNNALYDLINNYFLISARYASKMHFFKYIPFITLPFLILTLLIISIIKKNKETTIISISYIPLFIVNLTLSPLMAKYYFIPFISILSIFIINIDKLKILIKYLNIILILIMIIISMRYITLTNAHANYYNINEKFAADVNYKVENAACIFILDPQILANLDEINYKYFFTPNLNYEQYPEIWDTLYKDIKNKKLEYVIIQLDNNNEVVENVVNNTTDTIKMKEKILDELNNNYEMFNEYNEFVAYKRK